MFAGMRGDVADEDPDEGACVKVENNWRSVLVTMK